MPSLPAPILVRPADLSEIEARDVVECEHVLDPVGPEPLARERLGPPVHRRAPDLVVRRELVGRTADARIARDVLLRPRAARHREAEPLAIEQNRHDVADGRPVRIEGAERAPAFRAEERAHLARVISIASRGTATRSP